LIAASIILDLCHSSANMAKHRASTHKFRCKDQAFADREMTMFSMTSQSIFVLRKQSSASCGLQTTGSFSLNAVLSTIGPFVRARKLSINLWYLELVRDDTVCRRPEPST